MFSASLVLVLSLITFEDFVSADECRGPNRISCRNLFTAERCQVLDDCLKVWKSSLWEKYKEDTSSKCTVCRTLSKSVPVSKLTAVCAVLQTPDLHQCEKSIESLRLKLGFSDMQRIEKERDTNILCNTLSACETDLYIGGLDFGTVNCNDCKYFMQYVQQLVGSKAPVNAILTFLTGSFCDRLPEDLREYCRETVKVHIHAFVNLVSMRVDPDQSCSILKLCNSAVEPALTIEKLIDPQTFGHQNGYNFSENIGPVGAFQFYVNQAASHCRTCVLMLNKMKQSLTSPEYREDVRRYIQERICNSLTYLRDGCFEALRNNFHNIVSEIGNINSTGICEAFRICDAKTGLSELEGFLGTKFQETTPFSGTCQLCLVGMEKIFERGVDRTSKANVHASLYEFCQRVPPYYRRRCERFVEKFGPNIIYEVSKGTHEKLICGSVTACERPSTLEIVTGYGQTIDQTNGDFCGKCKNIVDIAYRQYLQRNTEQELLMLAEQICSVLPHSFSSECNDIVNDHVDMVYRFLERGYTPEQICEQIGLCPEDIGRQTALCLRGPFYWCSDRETASKCNATDACPIRLLNQSSTRGLCDQITTWQICSSQWLEPVCSLTTSICRNQIPVIAFPWSTSLSSSYPQIWSATTTGSNTLIPGQLNRVNCTICVDLLNKWSGNRGVSRIPVVTMNTCNTYPSFVDRIQCDRVWAQRFGAFRQMLFTDANPEAVCQQMNLCQIPTNSIISRCIQNPMYAFASPSAVEQCVISSVPNPPAPETPQQTSRATTEVFPNVPSCEGGPAVFCQTFNSAQLCGEDAVRFCQDHYWLGNRPRISFKSSALRCGPYTCQ